MIWINEKLRKMREEDGFTLIELMVVVLIIAILIAIAIPTFLGARGRAQDRAAQSSLRNTVTNAKAIYTDNETYLDAKIAAMKLAEPSLTFVAAGAASLNPPNDISVADGAAPATASRFVAAALSSNNKCWYLQDIVAPGSVNAGTTWSVDDAPAASSCQVGNAKLFDAADWATTPGKAVPY